MRDAPSVTHRTRAASVALLLLFAACTTGGPKTADGPVADDGTTVTVPDGGVRGSISHEDGSPAVSVAVSLTHRPNGFDRFGNAAAVLFSGGLACLDRRPGAPCAGPKVETAATGSDGSYRVALGPTPAGGTSVDEYVLAAALPGPPSTPSAAVTAQFSLELPEHQVPSLAFWQPPVTAAVTAETASVAFPPLERGSLSTVRGYQVTWTDERGAELWTVDPVASGQAVDARILEDHTGWALVEAEAELQTDTTPYRLRFVAPPAAYTGSAGAPLSRGGPCFLAGVPVGPVCPLTDGSVTPVEPALACPPAGCSETTDVRVAIGPEQRVGLVVVRGCAGCRVELVHGGDMLVHQTPMTGPDAALVMPAGATGSAVVVSGPGVVGLREVSVWPPRPAADRAGPIVDQTGTVIPGTAPTGGPDDRSVTVAALVALVLLVGVSVAAARARR